MRSFIPTLRRYIPPALTRTRQVTRSMPTLRGGEDQHHRADGDEASVKQPEGVLYAVINTTGLVSHYLTLASA